MKTIILITAKENIEFELNFFEFLIFKRFFKNRRYKVSSHSEIEGRKIDILVMDEGEKK